MQGTSREARITAPLKVKDLLQPYTATPSKQDLLKGGDSPLLQEGQQVRVGAHRLEDDG